jgi:hypothetical protein
MKVDLKALRALIEEEMARIEQEQVRLKQQLHHITVVEEIAREADSSLRVVERSEEPASTEGELSEKSREWFQQV